MGAKQKALQGRHIFLLELGIKLKDEVLQDGNTNE